MHTKGKETLTDVNCVHHGWQPHKTELAKLTQKEGVVSLHNSVSFEQEIFFFQ